MYHLIKPSCNFCETLTEIRNLNNEITRLQYIPGNFITTTNEGRFSKDLFSSCLSAYFQSKYKKKGNISVREKD